MITLVERAAWILERNSQHAHTLAGLADACGVSRSHLAQAFGTATGMGVMAYFRGRRLSQAAQMLAEGAADILTVALEAGYGSHEAFTRAFGDQFGCTPDAVRRRGSVRGLALVAPIDLRASPSASVGVPRLVACDAVKVVGLSEPCSFATTIRIPEQWQRFMTTFHGAIPGRLDRMPIGLTLPADDEGEFAYVCAIEVRTFDGAPAGLARVDFAPREYAVFEHRGHVSKLYETYAAVWNQALPEAKLTAADAPAIERHHATFDPRSGEGGLSLWIPLEG